MHWKTLSSEYISNHIYFTARRDRCQREDGTVVDPYFVVELPTSATALALTADNRVLMVKQYRHPIGEVILETPGGFIDEEEDFTTGMQRELLEETGYAFDSIDYLGRVAANPGVLNNYTELYLAKGGVKQKDQQLDHNEEIEVVEISLDELIAMVMRQEIKQSLHVNCIFFALLKMGKLSFTG
ncbi:NUDIX hydrolase [Flavihumibacter fluvii]|uniref:NUDIX hydrolase n=1 Tax=Flavihumibacter fluvii TaxID=2838157 RepID=UPI001BDEB160|nr:NUDIX hydrolase [Flavihumibacter fluvii]ULQ54332.1 NUDIX hydrolase [Flavihumibacter fluvii]